LRDIFIFLCLFGMAGAAFYRPWLMTFTYLYADLIQPQRLSYYLFRGVPVSLIIAILAVTLFLGDRKKNLRLNIVQFLMISFVGWFTITSFRAVIQDNFVWFKWDAAWKSVIFGGVFLPLVLATRRRIEAALCLTVLCVGLVAVSGALKTLAGGGGYRELKMIVDSNNGLYESSTISTAGMAIIPLVLYLYKHSALVGQNIWTKLIAIGLCASSLLIVVGTEARTGLICVATLAAMYFVRSRRKPLFAIMAVVVVAAAIPALPQSFKSRMLTIAAPSEDVSAATRTNVWSWTLDFAKSHPLGGGFRVNRLTSFKVVVPVRGPDGTILRYSEVDEIARAFHSSYFEVLAEQGWPGLVLYLSIIGGTLVQLGSMMRRYAKAVPEDRWKHDLAQTMFRTIVVYAVGGAFVGIAYQTALYIVIAIALAHMQVDATARSAVAKTTMRLRPRNIRVAMAST